MAKDPEISDRMERISEIIDQLDAGEVPLEEGEELHEEAKRLLAEIRDQLYGEDGEVVEVE
jgi:exodeoxyribonuclease VII small subunit